MSAPVEGQEIEAARALIVADIERPTDDFEEHIDAFEAAVRADERAKVYAEFAAEGVD